MNRSVSTLMNRSLSTLMNRSVSTLMNDLLMTSYCITFKVVNVIIKTFSLMGSWKYFFKS